MKDYLSNVLFTARYNLFELMVLFITYVITDYTFDDTYDAYMFMAALMILIWGASKKEDCEC